jgi:hypothetical protein
VGFDEPEAVPGFVVAVNAGLESWAGRRAAEVKVLLRQACEEVSSPLDEQSLTAFAGLISAGLPVEVRWRGDRCAGPAVVPRHAG